MKYLFTLCTLIATTHVKAQYFERDASNIADGIFNKKRTEDIKSQMLWQNIYDSVLLSLVKSSVNSIIDKGHFTYPLWHLMTYTGENSPPNLTNTGRLWLEQNYNIRQAHFLRGCVIPESYRLHDSLMNHAIEQKFGKDVFSRAAREADSLDNAGVGLILPYVVSNAKTNKELLKVYEFVNELPRKHFSPDSARYIGFNFKNGKVSSAVMYWNAPGLGGMSIDPWWQHISDNLTYLANYINWTPPKFLDKPVDKLVFWSVSTGKLFFD